MNRLNSQQVFNEKKMLNQRTEIYEELLNAITENSIKI